MNAIPPIPPEEPAAERTVRHLAMLRELAEIGMALARALGEHALAALAPPAAETPEPAPAPPSRIDPGLAFARVARVVRQIIALEARIVADRDAPPRPRHPDGRRPDRSADPRHATIRRVLHEAARLDARGAAPAPLLRRIDERLGDELDADPDQDLPIEAIIAGLCEDLGLGRDLARVSDELLDFLIRAEPPGSADGAEDGPEDGAAADLSPQTPPATPHRSGPDPP
jgi:hypothetical protein